MVGIKHKEPEDRQEWQSEAGSTPGLRAKAQQSSARLHLSFSPEYRASCQQMRLLYINTMLVVKQEADIRGKA
jgi:hypothetical protein